MKYLPGFAGPIAKKNWAKVLRWLPILIAILALLYQVGDYWKWWDDVRGRSQATEGVRRLSSVNNLPTTLVWWTDSEFEPLLKLILAGTESDEVKRRYHQGNPPSAITRLGGTIQVPVGDVAPQEFVPRFTADVSPIVFVYTNSVSSSALSANPRIILDTGPPLSFKGEGLIVGTVGDIREWISTHRERERFLVATLFIGAISIIVTMLDLTKSKEPES